MDRSGSWVDLARFEAVGGREPFRVLDVHPGGQHVALQCGGGSDNAAGIWSIETGELLDVTGSEAESIPALCWSADGTQVIALRDRYRYRPELHAIIGSRLQSEYTHYLERRSWPEFELFSRCQIRPPTGWMDNVAVSPSSRFAAFTWCEQHGTGFELVRLSVDKDEQLPAVPEQEFGDLLHEMAFTPDDRYLVLVGTGWNLEWWADTDDYPVGPSTGGPRETGWVGVFDLRERTLKQQQIIVDLPTGWLPPDRDSMRAYIPGKPRFEGADTFIVPLQTGEERRFSVYELLA